MQQALLCAIAYLIAGSLDNFTGLQAITRPIVLGPIVGLFCGDVKVGAIMGAQLEAIYMGVSAIGGVISSNYRVATTVGVGLVIMTGIDMETGVAIATAVGAVVNSFSAILKAINAAVHPMIINLLKKGNYKGYVVALWLQTIFISNGFNSLIIFLCMLLGSEAVQLFVSTLPAFVMTGLSAAGNMLVVIGLALTTQAIWMKNAFFYVLLGFVLLKYVGLAILPIAAIGVIIAVLTFNNDMELKNLKESLAITGSASTDKGGDDFYG